MSLSRTPSIKSSNADQTDKTKTNTYKKRNASHTGAKLGKAESQGHTNTRQKSTERDDTILPSKSNMKKQMSTDVHTTLSSRPNMKKQMSTDPHTNLPSKLNIKKQMSTDIHPKTTQTGNIFQKKK